MPAAPLGSIGERRTMRLAPRDRIRKRFEFRRVRDRGRRIHTRSFVLLIAPSERPHARLGITVSRQVGNAVRRNRVKRLVREAFRLSRRLLPDACDLVVIAKGSCAVTSRHDVERELAGASAVLGAAYRAARGAERRT